MHDISPFRLRLRLTRRGVIGAGIALSSLAALRWTPAALAQEAKPSHGLSLFGDLKYPADFQHFDYVNPDAPKGGAVKFAAIGTFDTLNPFQLKGVKAEGAGGLFDTLMLRSVDEADSEYGLIAESVEIAPDRTWVQYNLRAAAKFHDGTPITPDDVLWTFDALKTKGDPHYRLYYADVLKAEKVGERGVKFTFRSGDNRELASIVGQLPVLSQKYWSARDFEKTTLEPPLGSGPYKIDSLEAGRSITYRRVADYWGADLPVNRGRNNFDTMRYDYYRDASIALEAFKAGEYDLRVENVAKNWANGYNGPALDAHLFTKAEIPNKVPQGMQAFGLNTRNPLFQDPHVRRALGYLFDFEWTNKNLFFGAYTRTASYFSNSELASSGLPSAEELKILEKFKGDIPDEVFTEAFVLPKTDGSGNVRDNLRAALKLFETAGWTVKDGQLVNAEGKNFAFEFLLAEPEFERVVLPYVQNLARVGVKATVRTIDPAQYENRMQTFDYEVTVVLFPESLSPGNEQREYWSSGAAAQPGSNNLLGVKSKPIDALVDLIVNAPDRESLVTRVHALDRVLLHNYYVVPNWHLTYFRVAYWDKFQRPKNPPPYDLALDTWWIDPTRAKDVEARKTQVKGK
jgi:microcin C transport system substrate-binding protein